MAREPIKRSIVLGQTALSVVTSVEKVEVSTHFSVSVNGLDVKGKPKFPEWDQVGELLRTSERGIQFALGDYLVKGEALLGEKFAQIVDYSSGWSQKTCDVYRWLAAQVPQAVRRMDKLTIRHHLLVATLSTAQQKEWLDRAAEGDDGEPWTVKRLKDELSGNELLPPTYWVLVSASSLSDQAQLVERLQNEGRSAKASVSRKKKALTDGGGQ